MNATRDFNAQEPIHLLLPRGAEESETGSAMGQIVSAAAVTCMFALLLLVAALYSVKVWRRLAPYFAGEGSLYRVCFRATLDRLGELALVRREGETREQFACRLATLTPEFTAMTHEHLRGALGLEVTLTRKEWLALQSQIAGRLAVSFSRMQRILGVLNPMSWMRTR